MPYQTFFKWLFDGDLNSPIPKYVASKKKKLSLSHSSSPITSQFLVKIFIQHGQLNYYFDKHLNNFYLWSIDKSELMKFVKQCAYEFRVVKRNIPFFPRKEQESKLFEILQQKHPYLKNYELQMLCEHINNSSEKDSLYAAFGLEPFPKKKKLTKKNKTNNKRKRISMKSFVKKHFKLEK